MGKVGGSLEKSAKLVPEHLTDDLLRHVHARPSRELPLDRVIKYDQYQLPQVEFELYSTLSRMLAVCRTCLKWASACPTR